MKEKLILVTGGSRSGKSKFAEQFLKDEDEVLYIATSIVCDGEMEDRVNKHKEKRNSNWTTKEAYVDLDKVIRSNSHQCIMVDCVTIMITNLMFLKRMDFEKITASECDELLGFIKGEFNKLVSCCKDSNKTLVIVTNEVGSGIVPENKLSRVFRDYQGYINQFLAEKCDEVYLVSCGLPLKLK